MVVCTGGHCRLIAKVALDRLKRWCSWRLEQFATPGTFRCNKPRRFRINRREFPQPDTATRTLHALNTHITALRHTMIKHHAYSAELSTPRAKADHRRQEDP